MFMLFRSTCKLNQLSANFDIYRKMSVASSNLLINNPKYSFLKDLGLKEINPGVFDGTWKGSGKVGIWRKLYEIIALL